MRKQDVVVFVNDYPKMPRGIQVEVEIPDHIPEGPDEDRFIEHWILGRMTWDRLSDLVPEE